jgi:hypothetical protein
MRTIKLKSGARGYLNLKALPEAPDFKAITHADIQGTIGEPLLLISLNKGEKKAGAMLKKGYVAVGARSEEVIVSYDKSHIEILPCTGDPEVDPAIDAPAKAEATPAATPAA